MDTRPVGVFDSGLGGLTCVREFHALGSREDIVFFGDNARVPYGTRSAETIVRYALEDISFLLQNDVKLIIAACGTVSSTLPKEFSDALPVPYLNVVEPTASAAARATKNGKIGVIGTPATIRSGAFERAIALIGGELQCFTKACPLFVPLVENGYFGKGNEVARLVARDYLAPLMSEGIDTLLLGCTHYPLLADVITDATDGRVTLINSSLETAKRALELLTQSGERNPEGGGWHIFSSDDPDDFSSHAEMFLGHPLWNKVQKTVVSDITLDPCFKGV